MLLVPVAPSATREDPAEACRWLLSMCVCRAADAAAASGGGDSEEPDDLAAAGRPRRPNAGSACLALWYTRASAVGGLIQQQRRSGDRGVQRGSGCVDTDGHPHI
ncbi:unnamed protein product [Lota lota]